MLPELTQRLLAQWPNLPMDRQRPNKLSFLGMRTRVEAGYALFLAFADSDNVPWGMVKIARGSTAATYLQREWNILSHFQKYKLDVPGVSLPRPIFNEVVSGARIVVTTAPPGQAMGIGNSPARDLATLADRLAQFAYATRAAQPAWMVRQELKNSFEQLGNTFAGLSDREMKVFEGWITQGCEMIGDTQTEVIATHGNLHRQNIWLQRGQIAIINWEHGDLASFPLFDLFIFVTTYSLPPESRGSLAGYLHTFREMYFIEGPTTDLVCQAIVSYCQALNFPLDGVLSHFGIFLAQAALKEYEQLLIAAERGYLPLLRNSDGTRRQPYRQSIKNQLWLNLLRFLIKEHTSFKLTTYGRSQNVSQFIVTQPSNISAEQL